MTTFTIRWGRRAAMLAGIAFATTICAVLPSAARAEWKPNRTVTLVVPYSPGGGTDVMARKIAEQLSRTFGQSVIVDNRPGAGEIGRAHV